MFKSPNYSIQDIHQFSKKNILNQPKTITTNKFQNFTQTSPKTVTPLNLQNTTSTGGKKIP